MGEPGDVTRLLKEWREGRRDAMDQLLPLIYPDLKRIAYGYLRRERPDHTLQATGLVHELYLKLCKQREANWEDRAHFYAFAAKIMRMILTDHARSRQADKRGGGSEHIPLSPDLPWLNVNGPEFLDLEIALDELEHINPRKTRMLELHHFLGCTTEESASILDISLATAERDLKFAKGWLYRRLYGEEAAPGV